MRRTTPRAAAFLSVVLVLSLPPLLAEDYWVTAMLDVHSHFTGTPGAVARFGDSITYSGAFFKPLQWSFTNGTTEDQAALGWLHSYVSSPCWSWQDDAVAYGDGCYSGTTSAWPLQAEQAPPAANINYWLTKLRPEMAVVMWGTNDLGGFTVADYTNNMRQVIQACKTYGTIPLLTTIPPRRGYDAKSAQFAQAMRDLAVEQQVPLIDYNSEILTRRPGSTWDGTLISSDGVHPSYNGATAQDFSPSSLNSNGYLLRNWATLHTMYDVYNSVLAGSPPPQRPTVAVFDVAPSDVPGPEPIRRFPAPAAANWDNARCIFDNSAQGLQFSPGLNPADYNLVSLPVGNAEVTIHGVTNNINAPAVDDSYRLYTNPEGSDADGRADNRFPYHIPRLARSHAQDYLAVQITPVQPTTRLGVYLPASSNSWGTAPGQYFDDQNFVLQDRAVWVIIQSVIDTIDTAERRYVSLKTDGAGSYCPFLMIDWNGTDLIQSVYIIHDVSEHTDRGVGIMDIYVPALAGDCDKDGNVDFSDYQFLEASFGATTGATWGMGDFNGDGAVSFTDYEVLESNYGSGIPEPAMLLLLTAGGVALMRRRPLAQAMSEGPRSP